MRVEAVVEVPKGSRNKYEMDHETGAIWLDREALHRHPLPGRLRAVPAAALGRRAARQARF